MKLRFEEPRIIHHPSSRYVSEKGQGLVEYALLLALMSVVVIGILALLGPTVNTAYAQILNGLQPSGAIESASATRTGNGTGNDVVVSISVLTSTPVTVNDAQSGGSVSTTCNGSCSVTLTGVGHSASLVTITASSGGTYSANYPAKN